MCNKIRSLGWRVLFWGMMPLFLVEIHQHFDGNDYLRLCGFWSCMFRYQKRNSDFTYYCFVTWHMVFYITLYLQEGLWTCPVVWDVVVLRADQAIASQSTEWRHYQTACALRWDGGVSALSLLSLEILLMVFTPWFCTVLFRLKYNIPLHTTSQTNYKWELCSSLHGRNLRSCKQNTISILLKSFKSHILLKVFIH